MSLLKKKRSSLRLPTPKVGCPFCWDWLPKPERLSNVHSSEGCRGGRCKCGAVFVLDEIGRAGGQALLDALVLACDGNLDRALKLNADEHYQVKTKPLRQTRTHTGPTRGRDAPTAGPKVWAVRLLEPVDVGTQ